MDENEILTDHERKENAEGSDPHLTQDAESHEEKCGENSGEGDAPPQTCKSSEKDFGENEPDLGVSANSCEDPDSGSADSSSQTAEVELARLRDELNDLRKEVSKRDLFFSRLGEECEDFALLFPDVPLSSLPESVWDDVKKGIPLSASYALRERRLAREKEIAEAYNQKNGIRSSGKLSGTENDYFSPDEVRAMSEEDVRKNYTKIMQSMPKWRG